MIQYALHGGFLLGPMVVKNGSDYYKRVSNSRSDGYTFNYIYFWLVLKREIHSKM